MRHSKTTVDDLLFESRTSNGDWYDDEINPELEHIQDLIDDLPPLPDEETNS